MFARIDETFGLMEYILIFFKNMYPVLNALRSIVRSAHERENTVLPYEIAITL